MTNQTLDMVGNREVAELIRIKNEEDTASEGITSTEDQEPLRALPEWLKEVNQHDATTMVPYYDVQCTTVPCKKMEK